ncbi:hypothetical protein TNIN_91841 [Trichonephila inaurata madagascariensis]|uniref:Uncharacterized protein n=1 Tax=Trichonephila inaurata madagascariensis TaxID=2747483 RepID=A0A8X7BUR5_9ARAC|nr:hypothetical protein TNIN_91841 [Trichonephila inaurata madagascariensis]
MRGSEDGAVAEARPTFPDVRGLTPFLLFRKRDWCVSECPTHILDPVRNLIVQVKAPKCEAQVLESESDDRRGKTVRFSTCVVPREIRGPMRSEGQAVARKPVQHFLMSVVRLKTLFLGSNRDAKLASDHLTQPETGRLLICATSAVLQRTLSDRGLHPFFVP